MNNTSNHLPGQADMTLFVTTASPEGAIPIHPVSSAGLKDWLGGRNARVSSWAGAQRFKAGPGEMLLVPSPDGGVESAVLGVPPQGLSRDPLTAAVLSERLPEGLYRFEPELSAQDESVLFAWALGTYAFERYRSENGKAGAKDGGRALLAVPPALQDAIAHAARTAEAVFLVRDLVNTPASDMGPAELEAVARAMAKRFGASIEVTAGDELLERNFPLIHAVGRASPRAPRLIDLTWGAADALRLTLVGKGVCFDTGGLNLKPGASMLLMKKDMGGAAHVLGLAHMVMAAGLPVRLRVLIPAVENAVAGNAFRPGDVLKSRKGLSVEIGNTDAEGRLILADALALADEESPDLLIDMATLTGAARVALGPDLAPFYTKDDALARIIEEGAQETADPVWRMPLWAPYTELLASKVADVNHIGGQMAGSVTAALFLQKFVADAANWVHFDIYAWSPKARPGRPEGGEAQGIRALFAALRGRYSK